MAKKVKLNTEQKRIALYAQNQVNAAIIVRDATLKGIALELKIKDLTEWQYNVETGVFTKVDKKSDA